VPHGFPPVCSVRIGQEVVCCECLHLRRVEIRFTPGVAYVDLYACNGHLCHKVPVPIP
jgi:hypothetical protein